MILAPVIPNPAHGDYEIMIGADGIEVRLSTVLTQNLTSIPVFTADINSTSRPDLTSVLQESIANKTLSAVVGDWHFSFSSDGSKITMDGTMGISGITSNEGQNSRIDLSWIDFRVGEDIVAANRSLNRVGSSYLFERADDLALGHRPPFIQVLYTLNGFTRSLTDLRNDINNLALLDLSFVPDPVGKWDQHYDLGEGNTVWTSQMSLRFRILTRVSEPTTPGEEEPEVKHTATYEFKARTVYPGVASVDGNIIRLWSFVEEGIMAAVVGSLLGILLATYFADRRLTRSGQYKRRPAKR